MIVVGPLSARLAVSTGDVSGRISSVDRLSLSVPVTVTVDGQAITVTGVDIALLPCRTSPTSSTVWTATVYAEGSATVLIAGPEADQTDALPITADGADVWVRVIDNPEIQAVKSGRISVV